MSVSGNSPAHSVNTEDPQNMDVEDKFLQEDANSELVTISQASIQSSSAIRSSSVEELTTQCRVLDMDARSLYEYALDLQQGAKSAGDIKAAEMELEDLERIKEKFCEKNTTLLEQVGGYEGGADMLQAEVQRTRFLAQYRKTRNVLLTIVAERDDSSKSSGSSKGTLRNLKLPKVEIPQFSGSYSSWTAFKALFTSLVHNNEEFDNETKHHYLRSKVIGEALVLIQNLPLDGENYEAAWNTILKHYDDPFRQITEHLNALWRCQPSMKGSPSLKDLIVLFRQHAAGMQSIFAKCPEIDPFGQCMMFWFLNKCDKGTRNDWERELSRRKEFPNLEQFFDFMEARNSAYQRANLGENSSAGNGAVKRSFKGTAAAVGAASSSSQGKYCVFCKNKDHYLPVCPKYRDLSAEERLRFAKRCKLCLFCFRADCRPSRCSKKRCYKCRGPHNTLLHLPAVNKEEPRAEGKAINKPAEGKCVIKELSKSNTSHNIDNNGKFSDTLRINNTNESSKIFDLCGTKNRSNIVSAANYLNIIRGSGLNATSDFSQVILSTATVVISLNFSKIPVRSLLDQGSQFNFISRSLLNELKLRPNAVSFSVCGINAKNTFVNQQVKIEICSNHSSYREKIQCLVLEKITDKLPAQPFSIENWNVPPNLPLADPSFNLPGEIDLLLGGEIFWNILGNQQIRLGNHLPTLRESKFGWLVTGSIKISENSGNHCLTISQQNHQHLLDALEKFWTCESLDTEQKFAGEIAAEKMFEETTYRDKDGRFVVKLPFKNSVNNLGNSKNQALNRFYSLENRFRKDPNFKEKYVASIEDFLAQGHMKQVSEPTNHEASYYIPHHAVMKETSTSTKLRTVFDASMKSSTGVSLNDLLLVGPIIQLDLLSILFRFRLRRWVFVADIKQMYRQIKIDETDTPFQRIFWRASENEPVKIYEILVLLFGVASAPFLATRCLKALADEILDENSKVKAALNYDFYVDDALSGDDSMHEALNLQKNLIQVLEGAGFELGKWCANHPDLLKNLPEEKIETQFPFQFEDKKTIKTLGLLWLPNDDQFKIWFHIDSPEKAKTKREVLSVIASIFDPIGFIGPVTVRAKLIMQEIWNTQLGTKGNLHWDDELTDNLKTQWVEFASQLNELNQLSFPRYVFSPDGETTSFEIHGFCDASEKAYGAVVYIRSLANNSTVAVHLFSAKSKINSKKQTIPRLELCGALLLSELVSKVKETLRISHKINLIRLWSDSTIVLAWIQSSAHRWQTYVANRVQKIQDLTFDGIWDHVGTKTNPADMLSRGSAPTDLKNCDLWWNGPNWLHDTVTPWSKDINFIHETQSLPEMRKVQKIQTFVATPKNDIFEKFRNYSKLVRTMGYVQRFIRNAHPNSPRISGELKRFELDYSNITLIKLSQNECFSEEIHLLQRGRASEIRGSLTSLAPFLDEQGVLRVGGRLSNADLSFEQRYPILLSPHHRFTKLLVHYLHLKHLHAGPSLLKSVIRRQYWILRIHSAINHCVLHCITCIRQKSKVKTQLMANLPKNRVIPSKPFSITGVDYAGPVILTEWRTRSSVQHKAYIAVFVCFSTKAVHLELVSDMSSEAFIAALERFVARRGIPQEIHSDNGTTFVGANNALKRSNSLFQTEMRDQIHTAATQKGIEWHFTPPYAPHFGGLWEAGVKSVKSHLKKILGSENIKLTFEQYNTVLTQIEACLNSRPLYAESTDPSDLNALTPGHFLIGGPITALPNPDLTEVPDNRLKYWQRLKKLHQTFWKRWSAEYLNTLQQRTKWRTEKDDLQVGNFVLIKDSNLPPAKWALGRIVKLHSGTDNKARVVTVETVNGPVTRAISRIIPLPLTDEFSN